MFKTITIPAILVLVTFSVGAQQNTWRKTIPGSLPLSVFQLSEENGHYLIGTQKSFVQVDGEGFVTGYFPSKVDYWTSVRKKYSAAGNHPYFLIAYRTLPLSTGDFTLAALIPGTSGFKHSKTFADNLGTFAKKYPVLLELNDSIFLVFGTTFVRKIKFNQSEGFTEEWAKPLNLPVIAAVKQGDSFIVANENGIVRALDADMNVLWTVNHAVKFNTLKATPDGFIGCGRLTNGTGIAILKLDISGAEVWMKVTSDIDYYDIIRNAAGEFVLTGKSDSFNIMWMRLDANGQLLGDKQEYGKGNGGAIVQISNGGYVIAARGTNFLNAVQIIKTDENGLTASSFETDFIQNRQIKTAGLDVIFEPSPSLFFDGHDGSSFFIPLDSNSSTLFSFVPWFGGLDENSIYYTAAASYAYEIAADYRSGNVNSKGSDFNHVWAIRRSEIAALRRDFGVDQVLDQAVPFDLLSWPAKGNPNLRYNLDFSPILTDPALYPAPFVDYNGDGIYNVYDGDYPLIKGDQMAWWVLTDSTYHGMSGGNPLLFDLAVSAFVYDCPQNETIKQSVFADIEVINRATNTYSNTYAGYYADFDLGNGEDDYFGSLPDANTFYAYNKDDFDEDYSGLNGFGSHIPVQSVTLLNQTLDHTLYMDNFGIGVPMPGSTELLGDFQFYNFLQGKWKDGSPLTSGGTGLNPGSTDYTNFIFPDNPSDPAGWSMCSANLFSSHNKRFMGSHGPFTFAPGDTFQVEIAFTFHPDIPHPCPDILGLVQPAVEDLQQWHDNGMLDATADLGQVQILVSGQPLTLNAMQPGATYLWSTGATTSSINITQPGTYTVTVTAGTDCVMVDDVLVQLGSAVQQPLNLPSWQVQPNPAKETISIECRDCTGASVKALLRNAQGVQVKASQGQSDRFKLDVQYLPAGVYWLELWSEGQWLGCKKVVLI